VNIRPGLEIQNANGRGLRPEIERIFAANGKPKASNRAGT
jgi:hypothetical protein